MVLINQVIDHYSLVISHFLAYCISCVGFVSLSPLFLNYKPTKAFKWGRLMATPISVAAAQCCTAQNM